ncbi:MAG: type II toxin-antitoxin system RelE/ParE family toxin [Clostridiales bacterium]|nr:type II toxin-antitoxin system RelE/ParE family toxin [Clostridiales bacterium]
MQTTKYKRIILPQAEADIREALNYISNELCNPAAASKLLADMVEAMESVSMFPN